ncbi:MAG TPA: AAA family ATPase [Kofleriaceae bacterium]|nr:AAA family ATPase [Kofleriaceae bacterium]
MSAFNLDPRGAVAVGMGARPGARDIFRQLGLGAARCDLGDEGLYLAEEIAAGAFGYGDDDRAALACLVLAAQIAARMGATRLPLDSSKKGPLRALVHDIVRVAGLSLDADDLVKRMLARAKDTATLGAVLGPPTRALPLVVDDACLYTHRSHTLESEVATLLASRLGTVRPEVLSSVRPELLSVRPELLSVRPELLSVRPERSASEASAESKDLSDEQQHAVTIALSHPLAVISGGPGTGKTRVAGAIVRALGAARIAVAAPTGKAAARLASSVGVPGLTGQTLHRLLGLRPDRPDAGHDAHDPLPFDAVIVDEASMIDLALAARLLRALRPDARLILLGDARQLPSVDAGQVLADLVRIADDTRAPWCAKLAKSFRAADDDGGRAILAAARVIDDGKPPAHTGPDRVAHLRAPSTEPAWRGVELFDPVGVARHRNDLLDKWFARAMPREIELLARTELRRDHGAWAPGDADKLARLFAHHDARRILCATRGQPTGADAINARLHAQLLARASASFEPEFLPGEPVILTANDHERGFWNGDTGVIARVVEDGVQRFRVILRREGELVPVPLDAVRHALELAWALTVHKSQGSEYDEVLIVLPDEKLPIATRELLYTALTRARRGAVILGPKEILTAAAAASAPRYSGLPARVAAIQASAL